MEHSKADSVKKVIATKGAPEAIGPYARASW